MATLHQRDAIGAGVVPAGSASAALAGPDPAWRALYRIGAVAAASFVALTIVSIVASLGYLTIAFGLVQLSDQLVTATGESERAAATSAAMALLTQYNAPSLTAVLWPAAILVVSIPMLRGVFPRSVACLGILTGAAGMLAEATRPAAAAYSVYGVLLLAWALAVAWKLHGLARSRAEQDGTT